MPSCFLLALTRCCILLLVCLPAMHFLVLSFLAGFSTVSACMEYLLHQQATTPVTLFSFFNGVLLLLVVKLERCAKLTERRVGGFKY